MGVLFAAAVPEITWAREVNVRLLEPWPVTPTRAIEALSCEDGRLTMLAFAGSDPPHRILGTGETHESTESRPPAYFSQSERGRELRAGNTSVPLLVAGREIAGAVAIYPSPDLGLMVASFEDDVSIPLYFQPGSANYSISSIPYSARRLADVAWLTENTVLLAVGDSAVLVSVNTDARTFALREDRVPADLAAVGSAGDAWTLGYSGGFKLSKVGEAADSMVLPALDASPVELKVLGSVPLVLLIDGTVLSPTQDWTAEITAALPQGTYAQHFCAVREEHRVHFFTVTVGEDGRQAVHEAIVDAEPRARCRWPLCRKNGGRSD